MRKRQEIEDTVQRLVCCLLPKMPPSDIRPAYQQNDMAGNVILNADQEYEYKPFNINDNFIYIQCFIGPNTLPGYVSLAGDAEISNGVQIKYIFYGPESAQLASCLWTLLQTEFAIEYFQRMCLEIAYYDPDITELHEIVNEEWFERHEFTMYFTAVEKIINPYKPCPAEQAPVDVRTQSFELGETIVAIPSSDTVVTTDIDKLRKLTKQGVRRRVGK